MRYTGGPCGSPAPAYLPRISRVSPVYLPCISHVSPVYHRQEQAHADGLISANEVWVRARVRVRVRVRVSLTLPLTLTLPLPLPLLLTLALSLSLSLTRWARPPRTWRRCTRPPRAGEVRQRLTLTKGLGARG